MTEEAIRKLIVKHRASADGSRCDPYYMLVAFARDVEREAKKELQAERDAALKETKA